MSSFLRQALDPFDVLRTTRALAPHDPKLNDTRWLIGESLRRVHDRAGGEGFHEVALRARDKIATCQDRVGSHAWPILSAIVIEGRPVRDCRKFVPEVVTPWRCDAIVTDRLRVALDVIGPILGVTRSVKTEE